MVPDKSLQVDLHETIGIEIHGEFYQVPVFGVHPEDLGELRHVDGAFRGPNVFVQRISRSERWIVVDMTTGEAYCIVSIN